MASHVSGLSLTIIKRMIVSLESRILHTTTGGSRGILLSSNLKQLDFYQTLQFFIVDKKKKSKINDGG
jgi:hypothetical protein